MEDYKELEQKLKDDDKRIEKLKRQTEWMLKVVYHSMEIAGVPEEKRREWMAGLKEIEDGNTEH